MCDIIFDVYMYMFKLAMYVWLCEKKYAGIYMYMYVSVSVEGLQEVGSQCEGESMCI